MPINVEQIIADVQAEDRARRDEELARHHQANEKLQEIFLAFNESNARRRLRDEYDATVDRQPSGVGILVRRIGKTVCTIDKDPGNRDRDIKIEIPNDQHARRHRDPDDAAKQVIQLLAEHKDQWPTQDGLEDYVPYAADQYID